MSTRTGNDTPSQVWGPAVHFTQSNLGGRDKVEDALVNDLVLGLVAMHLFEYISRDSAWGNTVHTNFVLGPLGSQAPCKLVHCCCMIVEFCQKQREYTFWMNNTKFCSNNLTYICLESEILLFCVNLWESHASAQTKQRLYRFVYLNEIIGR